MSKDKRQKDIDNLIKKIARPKRRPAEQTWMTVIAAHVAEIESLNLKLQGVCKELSETHRRTYQMMNNPV